MILHCRLLFLHKVENKTTHLQENEQGWRSLCEKSQTQTIGLQFLSLVDSRIKLYVRMSGWQKSKGGPGEEQRRGRGGRESKLCGPCAVGISI